MSNERLPIKFFTPREIDELRIEAGGSSEDPKWVLKDEKLKQHAISLYQTFQQFSEIINEHEQKHSVVPVVYVTKIYNDATSKSKRSYISSLFQSGNKNNVIGMTTSDKLIVKMDSISQMEEILKKLEDYESNKYAISCIETFLKFQPEMDMVEYDNIYKVKLIDFQDNDINIAVQQLFEKLLGSKKIEYKKINYSTSFPIYKINMNNKVALDKLIKNDIYEMLFSIEPMPKYNISLDILQNEESIDIIKPRRNKEYKILGILDSGIEQIPHIKPWLSEDRWTVYPESEIDSTHGTFVAGIALYGDSCEGQPWVGHDGIKLFDAAIFPANSKEIYEDELIANIKEVIEYKHEQVKVWNLSISIIRPVNDTKFSDFAIALDDIQKRYNVLICKSAGNCTNFIKNNPIGRINEGADSVRSLVVGSIAHKKQPNDIAEIDNPSPFSRIGPGPEYIIKPEVSHYGGNAGIDKKGYPVTTGVSSFSQNGTISKSVGTSFSTPRIASLATGLYQEMDEDFDPLLLKCLIIHSASYSDKLLIREEERTKYLGFGTPKSISKILYNASNEATLILRETLDKGEKIDIMDFPMPKSLIRNGYYTGEIIITLVYNPILDPSQGIEYCQSNIDVKFGSYDEKFKRDVDKRNILNQIGREGSQNLLQNKLYSKNIMRNNQDEFGLKERLLIQYKDKYYPVKKYAVNLSELSEKNKEKYASKDKQWYLNVTGLYRDYTEQRAKIEGVALSQDFCLIITIRDTEKKANIYDEVTQGLEEHHFWHANIKISNEIPISISSNNQV